MTTALIADDEAPLRQFLRRQLETAWPELEIIAEAGNGAEALQAIDTHRPDVSFLDIQMPVMTGLEVAPHRSFSMQRRAFLQRPTQGAARSPHPPLPNRDEVDRCLWRINRRLPRLAGKLVRGSWPSTTPRILRCCAAWLRRARSFVLFQ